MNTNQPGTTSWREISAALRHPLRLRLLVSGVAIAIAFFAIDMPFADQIARSNRTLKETRQRVDAAGSTELLRAQMATVQPRVAPSPDPNESVQFVLNGVRERKLTLLQLDTEGKVAVGPYEAVVMRVEVTGTMAELDSLLAWLETNERLLRVDSIRLDPPRGQMPDPTLRLSLLALKVRA